MANGKLNDIPEGTYDVGNGFYKGERNLVYSYSRTKIIKRVNKEEIQKIKAKYRYNWVKDKVQDIDGNDDETIQKILSLRNKDTKQDQ